MALLRAGLVIFALVFSSTLLAARSAEHPGLKDQKLTHLRFFLHEMTNPPNQTAFPVAQAATTSQSPTSFGAVSVIDDLLLTGPDAGSELIGRAQGLTVSADQSQSAMLMATNFVFTAGKYNGSTLTMLGRNRLSAPVRELPIVGGSGAFRFARGYAETSTHSIDQNTGIVIAEYNLYVLHY